MAEIHCNFGANFGFYDEGAYRCVNGDGDMTDAPESAYIINSVLPADQAVTNVEIGKFYGSASDGPLRVVYNPKEIHPWQHFSVQSSEHMSEFFTTAFGIQPSIPLNDQLWLWKELLNFLGLIGSFLAIVPMAALLLRVPVFATLRTPVPPALPALTTSQSKLFFWGSWVLSWVISWLSFMPVGKLDQYLFPAVTNRGTSAWFPQPTTNFILLWAVFNGLVGLLLFWLSYKFRGKDNGVDPKMWGIRTTLPEFVKTLALAFCVFIGFYSFVMFADYFFHTDFRIWTLDIRAFTANKFLIALQYWPFFFIFYAANSIAVNSANRVEGQKEGFNLFICGLGNSMGVIILNLSASNEVVGKAAYRRQLVVGQSGRLCCGAYVYADAGEGESTTDVVFTGHNMIAENGALLAERRFAAGLTISEIDVQRLLYERRRLTTFPPAYEFQEGRSGAVSHAWAEFTPCETKLTRYVSPTPFIPENEADRAGRCEEILTIAALGLKKRLEHTGAKTAVVGLSGGLDSTLALLITALAMGMLHRPASDIIAVTMPCFGTTDRTRNNAALLAERMGATLHTIPIGDTVRSHFRDIGHSMEDQDVTFENAQARERTQVLMDVANQNGGLVIGTGDLSELALGWCTYNGDHMSMYAVNASIPKTLVRHLVDYVARDNLDKDQELTDVLEDILDTPVSPELLPAVQGEISQRTEDLVGPYELHDFFLYYVLRWGFGPRKILRLAERAFAGRYDRDILLKWLKSFYRRFFAQQFKRSCMPDGPKVGSAALSPRGDWRMPSDASARLWLEELEGL